MEKLGDARRRVHVVAVPQRGLHGHVNPMLSFCRTLTSNSRRITRDVHVTLIVTQRWLQSTHHEAGGSDDRLCSFLEADESKPEEEALEELLDTALSEPPPDLIVADGFLAWAVGVGKRRNIPVASFWPASASLFTAAYHHQLILGAHSFPLNDLSGEERIDVIPGIRSIRLADLPGEIQTNNKRVLSTIYTAVTTTTKAQCIIFRTMNELEEAALKALRVAISVPIYPIGPAIPYSFTPNPNINTTIPDYIKWLDTQQHNSVLYISLGTYLSTAVAQIDELATGVKDSGVHFLWVAPDRADQLGAILEDHTLGKVVTWCDQMRILSHSSIGGFLTHCGWNSALEAAFAGVPALTFPLGLDQTLNSKLMVEDWEIGLRVKSNFQELVTREHISELLKKFMNLESLVRNELEGKCKRFKERLLLGVAEDGSTIDLDDFFIHV